MRHNVDHIPSIHALSETETNMKRIPVLIERDLEQLRSKLGQMQNHCVLEKEALKKQAYITLNKISILTRYR